MKTLDDFDFKNKRVLVRIDLNSPVVKGKVKLSGKFIEHAKTLRELKKKKAKIVVLAHQGRPKEEDFLSLKQHAKLLNKFVRVKFVDDIIGKKAVSEIKKLRKGKILLLENVRYLKEEFKLSKRNKIVKILEPLFDIFVNDAFSVSHRNQTSIVGFKNLDKCAGRVMEQELKNLERIKKFRKPCVYILGGAKPEDDIKLVKNNVKILSCGLFGQVCLISSGRKLGGQNKYLLKKGYRANPKLAKLIKKYKIEMPVDFGIKIKGRRKNVMLNDFPVKEEIFDIGPETVKKYVKIIKKAKTIFMKGTAGYCEERQFRKGTRKILRAIPKNTYSLLGGGHLSSAIKTLRIGKSKFGYVSLAGGALIAYLAGEKLPGVEILK